MGRKTKYKNDFPKRAFNLAKKGLYDFQIAKSLGISHNAYAEYRNEYNEFDEAIKEGREESTQELENALYKRAVGYTVDEETTEYIDDGKGSPKVKSKKKTKKHIQSDTAGIFLLKARRPEVYRETKDINLKGNIVQEQKYDFSKLSIQEKKEYKKLLEKLESKDD